MRQLKRAVLCLCAALLIAGCASSGFKADVTRFHGQGVPVPAGQLVTIHPAAAKERGPEFEQYAMIVGRALGAAGFAPAADQAPDLVGRLDWDRRPVPRESGGSDTRIGVGIGSFGRRSGVSLGTSFGLGDDEDDTDYVHEIFLVLEDPGNGERVWEGRATTVSDTSNTAIVVPYLAEALLTNFPGTPAETIRVEIPVED